MIYGKVCLVIEWCDIWQSVCVCSMVCVWSGGVSGMCGVMWFVMYLCDNDVHGVCECVIHIMYSVCVCVMHIMYVCLCNTHCIWCVCICV